MAEVYKIMQVSNRASGYRAGDRVYVGYINAQGEYREAQVKRNTRNRRAVRTAGYLRNVGNATLTPGSNTVRRARRMANSARR